MQVASFGALSSKSKEKQSCLSSILWLQALESHSLCSLFSKKKESGLVGVHP
jgi:hypothetical protein